MMLAHWEYLVYWLRVCGSRWADYNISKVVNKIVNKSQLMYILCQRERPKKIYKQVIQNGKKKKKNKTPNSARPLQV